MSLNKEIKILRLVTGEDIIATVTHDEIAHQYYLDNPIRLALVPPQGPGSQPGMMFVPWNPFSNQEKDFTLSANHVMTILNPIPEIANNYTAAISGIVLPNKPSFLLS